ncbi:ROK family protein [Cyclobacterium amurskyense]|uniref:ROK family member transcriptional repressor n=1 Tax=Cyclobacterium amurskyense TaxID=320787 RepID=A0A0H4PAN8_9BACT|nr:ROK family protein [Cyclobacterium amurskyense]AKP49828.1 ROK family member transcriptional repressor [Cyclobacterium amurskyense]|tara:strand:- start:2127 stop:2984 length:858 start_codon:yes stop_codon:yes gene_type:complete
MKQIVGVDIGGSHISAGLLDNQNLSIPDDNISRCPVDSLASKEVILNAWMECISSLKITKDAFLGIAMPAPFNYEQGISLILDQGKYRSLYQVNLKEALSRLLNIPVENIAFINDAAAFLQGESFVAGWGNEERLMGITLGTGLGGSYKFGEMAEDGAFWSRPFKGGIAEDLISTSFFVHWAKEKHAIEVDGLKTLLSMPDMRPATITVLKEFGQNLAELMLMQMEGKAIDKVVIGGNMVKAGDLFLPEVKRVLNARNANPEIFISKLGEKAAMIGAASLFERKQ